VDPRASSSTVVSAGVRGSGGAATGRGRGGGEGTDLAEVHPHSEGSLRLQCLPKRRAVAPAPAFAPTRQTFVRLDFPTPPIMTAAPPAPPKWSDADSRP
jgi:hypothetical protein